MARLKYDTVKIVKVWTPKKIAVIILNLEQYHFKTEKWVLKMHTEWQTPTTNRVDPDQTAPQSDLGLHCLPRPRCP